MKIRLASILATAGLAIALATTSFAAAPKKHPMPATSGDAAVDALNAQSLAAAQSGQAFNPAATPAPAPAPAPAKHKKM